MIKKLFLCIGFLSLIACGPQPNGYTVAADIHFECDEINALCNSTSAGKTVYMGLTRNLDFDCANELLDLEPSLFLSKFEYSGYAQTEFDGSYVYGVVTQWANSSGGKVHTFYDTDYKICAFLDDDGDESLGINEMVADQLFNPLVSFAPVTSWSLP